MVGSLGVWGWFEIELVLRVICCGVWERADVGGVDFRFIDQAGGEKFRKIVFIFVKSDVNFRTSNQIKVEC